MRAAIETRERHLTDAEFSQLLDGAQPSALAETHLAVCTICREELHVVQGSLGNFRTLGTAWAEAEAPRRIAIPVGWRKGFPLQTSWGAGLAATAMTGLLAFWLGIPGQPLAADPHGSTAHVDEAVPTNAELAADNSLLVSIDQELSTPGQPEMSAEQLRVTPAHDASRTAGLLTD